MAFLTHRFSFLLLTKTRFVDLKWVLQTKCGDFLPFISTFICEEVVFEPKSPFHFECPSQIGPRTKPLNFGLKPLKKTENPIFKTPGPKTRLFQFPKLFVMVFVAIPVIILQKRQNFQISAFWAHFQENGSRYPKMAPRNPWDMSNGQFQHAFSPNNIKKFFQKSVPEI